MKKSIFASLILASAAFSARSQGLISLLEPKGTVVTNSATGQGFGDAYTGAGSYYYELLDMTASSWAGLSASQQAGADNLAANPADVSLWTDSGVSGVNSDAISAGGITGLGGLAGTTAANWPAPTGSSYSSAAGYDYYVVMGWTANAGTSWETLSNELQNGTVPALGIIGETPVMYNYAGGGTSSLGAPNVFSPSSFTGLAGSGAGANPTNPELYLLTIPEPPTFALVGLGGLSMLFLRRRKS